MRIYSGKCVFSIKSFFSLLRFRSLNLDNVEESDEDSVLMKLSFKGLLLVLDIFLFFVMVNCFNGYQHNFSHPFIHRSHPYLKATSLVKNDHSLNSIQIIYESVISSYIQFYLYIDIDYRL